MHAESIALARKLAGTSRQKPKQIELRRAVSTAYYAMFHAICEVCANALLGTKSPQRCERAWTQTYRAVVHLDARKACERCSAGTGRNHNIYNFPAPIVEFADTFKTMQKMRSTADYNPSARTLKRADVIAHIDSAEISISKLLGAPKKHKAAFAALILFKEREH